MPAEPPAGCGLSESTPAAATAAAAVVAVTTLSPRILVSTCRCSLDTKATGRASLMVARVDIANGDRRKPAVPFVEILSRKLKSSATISTDTAELLTEGEPRWRERDAIFPVICCTFTVSIKEYARAVNFN